MKSIEEAVENATCEAVGTLVQAGMRGLMKGAFGVLDRIVPALQSEPTPASSTASAGPSHSTPASVAVESEASVPPIEVPPFDRSQRREDRPGLGRGTWRTFTDPGELGKATGGGVVSGFTGAPGQAVEAFIPDAAPAPAN